MPAQGKKKGSVLLSYITEPFTKLPWQSLSNRHTNYWECLEIARLFSARGYAVDVINWDNSKFIPKKKYAVCVDVQNNLERLSKYLPKECKKVAHIVSSAASFQNTAEKTRLQELKKRRGVELITQRQVGISNNVHVANFLEGFGNKTVWASYGNLDKPIFPIPISSVKIFDFPENINFEAASKNFLWLGGGGAVLKGLDLVLEAFAQNPDLTLHICGPVQAEKDFCQAYNKELFETANIHLHGRIDVTSDLFKELSLTCGALIYPAFSEGTSGAVVQAMQAGIVPIITPQTGIYEEAPAIIITEPTVESVTKAVKDFSLLSPERIETVSRNVWKYAQAHYTREEFSKAYGHFIDDILKI
jgi:glycosyltransferase involved in cell wall biosynthesis